MWLFFISFSLRHQMVSQLWAVLCQHPAWLLTPPQPKCHLTWPTVLLLLVTLLDMGGNMRAAPPCPPTTVTFPHRWPSRECRQPEKVVILSPLLHSDEKFRLQQLLSGLPFSAHPPPLPRFHTPPLLPSTLPAWRAGFTDLHPLCWWHLNISCHNLFLAENLTRLRI